MAHNRPYGEYLNSLSWKVLRAKARKRANHQCEFCGGPPDHVHHVKYPKKYEKDHLDNLVVACESCHAKLHGIREEQEFFGLCMLEHCDGSFRRIRGDTYLHFEVIPTFLTRGEGFFQGGSRDQRGGLERQISIETFAKTFGQEESDWLISSFDTGFIPLPDKGSIFLDVCIRSKLIKGWLSGKYRDAFGRRLHDYIALTAVMDEDETEIPADESWLPPAHNYLLPVVLYLPFRQTTRLNNNKES